MLRIEYRNENGDPIGTRDCKSSDTVICDILESTSFWAGINPDPALTFLCFVSVIRTDATDGFRLHAHPNIADVENVTYFQSQLWMELCYARNEEFAHCFDAALHEDFKTMTDDGQAYIGWYGQPEFEIAINISRELTCGQLENQIQRAESLLKDVWRSVEELSHNVKSSNPPTARRSRRKVFICHSSRDKQFARKVADSLRGNQIEVWIDEDEILVGHDFVEKMEDGLSKCHFVVVAITPNFLSGPWAKEEYKASLTRQVESGQVVLLPALKKDCDIPPFLRPKLYADFRKDFRVGIKVLVNAIRNHVLSTD